MELIEGPDGRWGYKNEPTECPNGHGFGPRRVFISSLPGAGLRWQYVICGAVITQQMIEQQETQDRRSPAS